MGPRHKKKAVKLLLPDTPAKVKASFQNPPSNWNSGQIG